MKPRILTGLLAALFLGVLGDALAAQELSPRVPYPKATVRALPLPDDSLTSPPGGYRLTVKFEDRARVRATEAAGLRSLAGVDLVEVERLADAYGLRFARLIQLPEDDLAALSERAAARSGRAQPDLSGILIVLVEDDSPRRLEQIGEALQALPVVEYAYIQTLGVPPPGDIAPPTPDLFPLQTYHSPNPGIDAAFAASRGVTGAGIRLSDCEYGWVYSHEDLVDRDCHPEPGHTIHPITIANGWDQHGTAVLGETSSVENGYGCSGMAPGAEVYTFPELSVEGGPRRVTSIANAIAGSAAGDVVLLEMQTTGAGGGYGPAELDPSVFAVSETGVNAGVIVIGAAGNGNQDLDGPAYGSYRAQGDSGAILVGAGSDDASHDKLGFSTYGTRINVQGWGTSVFTLGYGSYAAYGGDPNQNYTGGFNGTSSASPFVAAACVLLQDFAVTAFGAPLSPAELRGLVVETGRAQGSGGHIGPLPDLFAAMEALWPEWTDLGSGLAGTAGVPRLIGHGSLDPGTPWALDLTEGLSNATAAIFVSGAAANLPFRGGMLVPAPQVTILTATDGGGRIQLGGTAPAGLNPGQDFFAQIWIADPAAIAGAAASNAVTVQVP